jgi:predicted dehydrogenase
MDWKHPIVVFGTDAVMKVPDPNTFGGEVLVKGKDWEDWTPLPVAHGFSENSRGLGVRQISLALQGKGENLASGDLALHVLEAMLSVAISSEKGTFVNLETRPSRPNPMPVV